MRNSTANTRRLLTEEVDFWQDYIAYCSHDKQQPVPQRAFDALKLAQNKLAHYLSISEWESTLGQPLH